MKCPIDKTEMKKGLLEDGYVWSSVKPLINLPLLGGAEYVDAYRCLKCGKVELKIEGK